MNTYEQHVFDELKKWEEEMTKRPTLWNKATKSIQSKINEKIPQKVHDIVTGSIKQMIKATLLGSEYTTRKTSQFHGSLQEKDEKLKERLAFYKKTAAFEGAGTGAGGILLGLADFPLLLGIKMKFLFEAASIYGLDVKDYRERIFILHVFRLAFSDPNKRKEAFEKVVFWEETIDEFPAHPGAVDQLNWQELQQDYRDHIDLIKMLQMVPGLGAIVGAYANYHFLEDLGEVAQNCFRWRVLMEQNSKK
ncbi:EcsC family protein [Bacillus sp. NEB1478]|uniref:EcsC family protein n=1 Tax=Bacillus sp. NEB1478 TaxID=3073816 RepID=UPI002872DA78|nr:EcsC family protein [Bacillus sp. NEB1478]WNB91437.1 EcsC family protein [Bacillus sp. NEB1478]